MNAFRKLVVVSAALAVTSSSLLAADLTVKSVEKAPPKELDVSFQPLLQNQAIQVLSGGKPAFEFWLRKEIPLKAKPASTAKALDSIEQTIFVGAVVVGSDQKDYRDDPLPAGTYTMRFCLQPSDGNHQGSSDYPYYVLLTAVANDPKLDSITNYKALIRASGKDTPGEHAHVISLRPPSATDGDSPKLLSPIEEHKSVRVKVPAKAGDEPTELVFEIVVEGKGHR